MQIANEISATYPSIKHVYIGRGNHVDIDGQKASTCLIVRVQSNVSIPNSTLEQLKNWIRVRLQTENVEIDHTVVK